MRNVSRLGLLCSEDRVSAEWDVVTSLWRMWEKSPDHIPHSCMSTFCMYCWLWSVHLIVICLFEYVQEVSSQGETQWKAVSKAFSGRFCGLVENHHSCIPALKVTGSAVAVVYCALCLILNSISKSHKSPNNPTLTTT